MKIILFSRSQVAHAAADIERLFDAIGRHSFDYAINREFAEAVESRFGRAIDPAAVYDGSTGRQPARASWCVAAATARCWRESIA